MEQKQLLSYLASLIFAPASQVMWWCALISWLRTQLLVTIVLHVLQINACVTNARVTNTRHKYFFCIVILLYWLGLAGWWLGLVNGLSRWLDDKLSAPAWCLVLTYAFTPGCVASWLTDGGMAWLTNNRWETGKQVTFLAVGCWLLAADYSLATCLPLISNERGGWGRRGACDALLADCWRCVLCRSVCTLVPWLAAARSILLCYCRLWHISYIIYCCLYTSSMSQLLIYFKLSQLETSNKVRFVVSTLWYLMRYHKSERELCCLVAASKNARRTIVARSSALHT